MAYATLGTYVFERLIGFSDFETTGKERFAEHALINLQPRLDHTGSELRVIKFGVHYHRDFCVIEDEVSALWAAKNKKAINTLVLGNGRVIGDFVIEEIVETVKNTFNDGTYIEVNLSITLKECVIQDKLGQADKEAEKNADGLSGNNPDVVRGTIKQYSNATDEMAEACDKAYAESQSLGEDIDSAKSNFELFQIKTQQIISRTNQIIGYLNTAMDIASSPDYIESLMQLAGYSPWSEYAAVLVSDLGQFKLAALDILSFMPLDVGTINDVNDTNITLQSRATQTKKSQAPFAIQKGVRRI